ncbi:uncharacterized protein LOC112270657 [Brachypodium distachyon]|uniref:Uncharacterized protein n=1 Tax=Brachypodium distachyon TaxID=15368 RepID=A0A0Q3G7N4_BRADI|nr:uncharacterized protein LOC112270657 [Brachypodium distachyon]KQK06477.1 hypothetical protein BRADI_2g26538v3 [Brachypodium distachyon]|eukprot:XP_024314359.1 uncharacterized protein LOC112270657 [Brachypodium distachyon]
MGGSDFAGSSLAGGGGWAKVTGEVFWDPTAVRKNNIKDQKDEGKNMSTSEINLRQYNNIVAALEGENRRLMDSVKELEMVIDKMKQEKKIMKRRHRLEIRVRDGKELCIVMFVGAFAIGYVVAALITRGFI